MAFLEKASKIANSVYTVLILIVFIGGGAYALSNSLDIGIISAGITMLVIWLKILTDDIAKIKKRLKMRDN
jgi:hypothetical protein